MFFKKEARFLLDPSTIQDGRAVILFESGLLAGWVYLPEPALMEQKALAEKVIDRLRSCSGVKLEFLPAPRGAENWAHTALKCQAKLITVDDGLKEAARTLKGLITISLDEIYEGLKPIWRVGTEVELRIVKRGKSPTEGVGYLRDGTKVVVEDGAEFLGVTTLVVITGAVETPVGKLIFARPRYRIVK
jgi:uncharacterized protein YacL